jgi:trimeric autotransporter adhesin
MKSRAIIFGTIVSAAACFGLLPQFQAVNPPPDGCYPNFTTAEGCNALRALTTGVGNTGLGSFALYQNSEGGANTGVGAAALALNTADSNTAVGSTALLLNTDGDSNTAVGRNALTYNQIGSDNNAVGAFALLNNDSSGTGSANFNNAFGRNALLNNVDGDENDAFGDDTMEENTTGSQNTAMGDDALDGNTTGNGNTAMGKEAGNSIIDGNDDVVLGHNAGISIVHASNSIAIGVPAAGPFADFSFTCFIGAIHGQLVGDPGSAQAVFVDVNNNVGIISSSRVYKHDIQPMDEASEILYRLKPVTFKYNSDQKDTPQYGLIAEEVAQVDPHLVSHDKNGELSTVHYEQINNMLLNEFLKEHKKVEELQNTVAQQQKGMEALTAQLKAQADQIQKVCVQVEMRQPATKVVANEP